MNKLFIDFQKTSVPIKPLHGVNSGPLTCNFRYDASSLFQEAGIPFSRLHDTEYPFGSGEYVDINCIFKNFDRDPEDPSAYNFAMTDLYLQHILKTGAQIIYRLGCTIEHQQTKRYIYPPKDYLKWAKICEHIIRHVNEGWADGHYMNIQYWEIWNEPDGILWLGSKEEFFEFFKTVICYLKERFPDLKFGGPALCVGSNDFSEGLLNFLSSGSQKAPLDFYSWHTYAPTPEEILKQSKLAHDLLIRYGYTNAESILDEWNYVETWDEVGDAWDVIQSVKGAAFNAAVLCALQNSTCDIATYYDAQLTFSDWWNGLFAKGPSSAFFQGSEPVVPKKGYFSFAAYNKLYQLGHQAEISGVTAPLYALAATNGHKHAVLIVNYSTVLPVPQQICLEIYGLKNVHGQVFLLDETHDLTPTENFSSTRKEFCLSGNSLLLLLLE